MVLQVARSILLNLLLCLYIFTLSGCVDFDRELDYMLLEGTLTTPDGQHHFKTNERQFGKTYRSTDSYRIFAESPSITVAVNPISRNLIGVYSWPNKAIFEYSHASGFYESENKEKFPLLLRTSNGTTVLTDEKLTSALDYGQARYDMEAAFALTVSAIQSKIVDSQFSPQINSPYRIHVPFKLDDRDYSIDLVVKRIYTRIPTFFGLIK